MKKLIFISHIHEEGKLAQLYQTAIEEEFGGFVQVFVSSDGYTIPAGTNFLKRIEQGLTECVGAIYLISPKSINRNWVNFELGAVWVRSILSVKGGGPEIPAIPICHSGINLGSLPKPIGDLSAIIGNDASQLETAFRSIQTAVDGGGKFRTDFNLLAQNVTNFENEYTVERHLIELFTLTHATKSDFEGILAQCKQTNPDTFTLTTGGLPEKAAEQIFEIEEKHLNNRIHVSKISHAVGSDLKARISLKIVFEIIDLPGFENVLIKLAKRN